jgi:hypothetical protein
MERRDEQQSQEGAPAPAPGSEGEDHREGPPGYDLDEQAAIEELEREQGKGGDE